MDPHPNESEQLREQLDELLALARRNQQTLRLFSEQELQLIGITSLSELLAYLLYRLPLAFDIESVALLLHDETGELARLLARDPLPSLQVPALQVVRDNSMLQALYAEGAKPKLARYDASLHAAFFAGEEAPRSLALLPLLRGGRVIGSLHFGSRDGERFLSASATDFLQHFAAIVAVCLENCLNHARLQQMGLTDPLTGINNRRYFEQRLGEAAAAALRHHRPLASLFIDVDHFKRINDSYGHPAGDEVLRTIARLTGGQLRHCDVLCRYGGEEFVVLLPDTDGTAALEIAERIRLAVAGCDFALPLTVTVSVGVAASGAELASDEPQQLARQLVATADSALYRAKAQGRNRVILFQEEEVL